MTDTSSQSGFRYHWLAGHPFLRFCYVGGAGFVVDFGGFLLLHGGMGLALVPARLVSFSVAVTLTWLLNRRFTFPDRASARRLPEWRRYVLVNGAGGLINLGIFFALTARAEGFSKHPLVALVIATSVSLVFNYTLSKIIAFRRPD